MNTIDESMSKWVNEYTCPGFMCVPCKPWKFGNEYHDAGCAMSDIIWRVDLREGMDRPRHLGEKRKRQQRTNDWDTIALNRASVGNRKDCCSRFWLLRFTGTNRTKEEGSLRSCPHKKRRYWPKHVPGDNVIAHFTVKQVGDADAIPWRIRWHPFPHIRDERA